MPWSCQPLSEAAAQDLRNFVASHLADLRGLAAGILRRRGFESCEGSEEAVAEVLLWLTRAWARGLRPHVQYVRAVVVRFASRRSWLFRSRAKARCTEQQEEPLFWALRVSRELSPEGRAILAEMERRAGSFRFLISAVSRGGGRSCSAWPYADDRGTQEELAADAGCPLASLPRVRRDFRRLIG